MPYILVFFFLIANKVNLFFLWFTIPIQLLYWTNYKYCDGKSYLIMSEGINTFLDEGMWTLGVDIYRLTCRSCVNFMIVLIILRYSWARKQDKATLSYNIRSCIPTLLSLNAGTFPGDKYDSSAATELFNRGNEDHLWKQCDILPLARRH